jgi:putative thioredoxin
MAGPHVLDVGEKDFETEVLERSRKVPVLVDFWAPWCGPCQVLGPTLEKIAEEKAGAFVLAKVNTDESPELAMAFGIQSIPMVALFKDGEAVDAFVGAQSAANVKAFLEPHLGPPPPKEEPAGDPVARAEAALAAGDARKAGRLLDAHLEASADDARARLLRARAALAEGDAEAVRRHVAALDEDVPERKAGAALLDALSLREACGPGEAHWRARLATAPGDLAAKHALACCLAVAGRHEQALQLLLEVVQADRRFQDGAARKAMVAVFAMLGPGHELAARYRRQLALYL